MATVSCFGTILSYGFRRDCLESVVISSEVSAERCISGTQKNRRNSADESGSHRLRGPQSWNTAH